MRDFANRAEHLNGCQRSRGFSLIESVITIVVLGIALTAIGRGLYNRIGHSADSLWEVRALQLGQSYLDDALALAYQENSPPGGGVVGSCVISGPDNGENNRSRFDDVDDYDGLSETGAFLDQSVQTDYARYDVSVTVSCANASGQAVTTSKLVQVLVSGPSGLQLRLAAVRGDF